MRKVYRYYAVFLLLSGLPAHVFSQVNEMGAAKVAATIVEPVSVSKTVNTDFGNGTIIVAGSVEMTPVGTHSRKGNIVLPISSGTFTAYTYYFTGMAGYTYTVSFPTSPMIINKGSDTMQVASFVSNPVLSSGSDLIAGVFVSVTPSNVTVNYN